MFVSVVKEVCRYGIRTLSVRSTLLVTSVQNASGKVLDKIALPRNYDLERSHFACAMLIRSLILLAVLVISAIADVEFLTPAAGSTVAGATTLSVSWKESGVKPPLTSFTTYTMFLVAGGDGVESQVCIQPVKGEGEKARSLLQILIRDTTCRSK